MKWVLIAVGGAFGSVLRCALQGWVQKITGEDFPAGTLAVNVLGCLLAGLLAGVIAGPLEIREEYRAGLMIGLLGGFTTFSAFGLESFGLATPGQWRLALLYILLSCGFGILAVWLGFQLARQWFGA